MDALLKKFVAYLNETMGLEILLDKWEGEAALPLYLREQYGFYQAQRIPGAKNVVFLADRTGQPPGVIEKNLRYLAGKTQAALVYVRETITSYERKRLIEKRISFVVPGNQMYLPFCGIDLREWYTGSNDKTDAFSPATQYLLLYLMQKSEPMDSNQTSIANQMGYTNMTVVRAFREIENAGLGVIERIGKEKHLSLKGNRHAVWKKAETLLNTPVQQKFYVRGLNFQPSMDSRFVIAGESALAKFSMLNEPRVPVWAIQSRAWKNDKALQNKFEMQLYPETGSIELELWRYPVNMTAEDGTVDKLSLYLAIKDCQDDRIQEALAKMLEAVGW